MFPGKIPLIIMKNVFIESGVKKKLEAVIIQIYFIRPIYLIEPVEVLVEKWPIQRFGCSLLKNSRMIK